MTGDIYYNPLYGDMWIVDGDKLVKINCGEVADIDEPVGFIKVGRVEGVETDASGSESAYPIGLHKLSPTRTT